MQALFLKKENGRIKSLPDKIKKVPRNAARRLKKAFAPAAVFTCGTVLVEQGMRLTYGAADLLMHPRPRVDGVELHGNPSVEFCQAAADAYMEKPEIVRDFLQETGARISIGEYQSQTGTMPSHVFGKVFPDRLLYINQHHGTYYLSDNLAAVPEKFYATPYHVLVGESSQLDTGSVKYIFHEETWHAFFTNCKIGEDPSFIEAYDKDIQYLGGLEQAKKIAPYRTQNLDSNMGQNEAWAAVCNGNGKAKAEFPHVTEYAEVYLERFDENKPFILNGTLEDSHIETPIADTFCTGRQYHAFSVKAPAVSTPAETGWFSDLPQLSEIFGTDFPDVIHRIDIYPNFRLAAASLTLGIMLAKHKDQYVGSHFGYVSAKTCSLRDPIRNLRQAPAQKTKKALKKFPKGLAWKIPATLIANTATGALALAAVSGNTTVKLFMVAGAAATVAFGGMAVGETLRKLPQKTNDPGFQPA